MPKAGSVDASTGCSPGAHAIPVVDGTSAQGTPGREAATIGGFGAPVLGSRVKLLGRSIERHAWRHYLGRFFATIVSELLRLPVYDTQCGAKMFRATDALRRVLERPFTTSWLFDVEILARFIALEKGGTTAASDRLYELPLNEWRDVAGSKLAGATYVKAASSVLALYREYGETLARQSKVGQRLPGTSS